eukprot:g24802.t1
MVFAEGSMLSTLTLATIWAFFVSLGVAIYLIIKGKYIQMQKLMLMVTIIANLRYSVFGIKGAISWVTNLSDAFTDLLVGIDDTCASEAPAICMELPGNPNSLRGLAGPCPETGPWHIAHGGCRVKGNFWEITGQTAFQWDSEIRKNHGDSWCICMWATARLIATVGCENVHLRCDATDVAYVEKSYSDGGVDLAPAKECLQKKCNSLALQRLDDATTPRLRLGRLAPDLAVPALICGLVAVGLVAFRRRGSESLEVE